MVTTELAPRGTVQVENEVWTAVAEDDIVVQTGEKVRVVSVEGPILTVARGRWAGRVGRSKFASGRSLWRRDLW